MWRKTSQFYVLARHFVQRFTSDDTLTFEDERSENLISKLVFLTVASGFMTHLLLKKYLMGLPTGTGS